MTSSCCFPYTLMSFCKLQATFVEPLHTLAYQKNAIILSDHQHTFVIFRYPLLGILMSSLTCIHMEVKLQRFHYFWKMCNIHHLRKFTTWLNTFPHYFLLFWPTFQIAHVFRDGLAVFSVAGIFSASSPVFCE